jgi:class 3 adenylate cyclase
MANDDLTKKINEVLENIFKAKLDASEKKEESIQKFQEIAEELGFTCPHRKSYIKFKSHRVATMLFMDIIGYSTLEKDYEMSETIETLNKVVKGALGKAAIGLEDVVCLPTGDGMCLCFFNETDEALRAAEHIQRLLRIKRNKGKTIKLRMGINTGNVVRVTDLKGCYNLAGGAINMTQRAMDCGDEDHILCTKKAHDDLKGVSRDYDEALDNYLGEVRVKHDVHVELYNYVRKQGNIGNATLPKKVSEEKQQKAKRPPQAGAAGKG